MAIVETQNAQPQTDQFLEGYVFTRFGGKWFVVPSHLQHNLLAAGLSVDHVPLGDTRP